MKNALFKATLALTTLSVASAVTLSAQDEDTQPPRPDRQALLERFDTNGDGQLDQAERQTAREAMKARAEQRGERRGPGNRRGGPGQFDTDGDGVLSDAERNAAAAQMRERASSNPRAMQRLDTDGDGVLSDAEWETARSEWQKRMDQRPLRGGKGKGKPEASE